MELEGRSILVTGGAGFIGSNLVDALVARGSRVCVLDDLSTGHPRNLQAALERGLEFHHGSVLDRSLVAKLAGEAEVIFHLAVQCLRVCFDRPHLVHEVNATGTLNLLEAARRAPRLERFVYVSSSEVYGTARTAPMTEDHPLEPTTTYGASKLAGEKYAEAYHRSFGMPTMVLRPFNTYGDREHHEGASGEVIPRFAIQILNGVPPVIFGDGSQTRDFTFVADTVEGLIRAAETDRLVGRAVNVARGQEVTIRRIAEMLLELLGRADCGLEFAPGRPGDVMRHYADVALLREACGWTPAIDIRDGLARYLRWLMAEHADPAGLLPEIDAANWQLGEPALAASVHSVPSS